MEKNSGINEVRQALLRRTVAELGALLQQLPADRRKLFEDEILAPATTEPDKKKSARKLLKDGCSHEF